MQQKQDKQFNVLQSAMILLLVINKLDSSLIQECEGFNYFLNVLEEKHYRVLFQGLCTIPDWKGNTENWPDFTSVKELLFKFAKIKADVVHVLTNMHRVVSSGKQPIPEVLFSMPIFHFAKGIWEPFKDATELVTPCPEIKTTFVHFKETTKNW